MFEALSVKFRAILSRTVFGCLIFLSAICFTKSALAEGAELGFELISITYDGLSAAGASLNSSPVTSYDGRFVAFESLSDNVVADVGNGVGDIFVRDRVTGMTERVSISSDGVEANFYSHTPAISADGRYVAFQSYADNLVPGDTNGVSDVFVHDRLTKMTERVSVGTGGVQGRSASFLPSISSDGRYVSFTTGYYGFPSPYSTYGYQWYNIFVHDRLTDTTELVSVSTDGVLSNRDAVSSRISGDGRYVLFSSRAFNLAPGAQRGVNLYLRDCVSHTTELMPAGLGQTIPASFPAGISYNGQYIAWHSGLGTSEPNHGASIYNRATDELINFPDGYVPSLSSDGRYFCYWAGEDGNIWGDYAELKLYDVQKGQSVTILKSADYDIPVDAQSISGDGKTLAFFGNYPLLPEDTNGMLDVYVLTGYLADEVPACPEDMILEDGHYEGTHSVSISWSSPSEGATPVGYKVYRNGEVVCDVPHESNTVVYTCDEAGLADCTEYCYTVVAYSSSDDESADCAAACITTTDETSPSVPANLTATAASGTEIVISWDASSDNCDVTASNYYIYDCAGSYIGSTDSTSYALSGLKECTEYCYQVSAVDSSGNESARSEPTTARTQFVIETGGEMSGKCGGSYNINSAVVVNFTLMKDGVPVTDADIASPLPVLYYMSADPPVVVRPRVVGSDGLFKYVGGGVWQINIKNCKHGEAGCDGDELAPGEYMITAEPNPDWNNLCDGGELVFEPRPSCNFTLVEHGKGK